MNKLVVVTGATRGIGRAVTERFAAAKFDLAVCSRNTGDLQVLKEVVERKYDVSVYAQAADASDKDHVEKFAAGVLGLHRPIDVLINNAGHFIPGASLEEPSGALESMIASNLYSAYHLTRALVGDMKQKK